MTSSEKKEMVEKAKTDREKNSETIKESQARLAKAVTTDDFGNPVSPPKNGVLQTVETAMVAGMEYKVTVYDAFFGEEAERFVGDGANQKSIKWVSSRLQAWHKVNMSQAQRAKYRSRMGVEFKRVTDIVASFSEYIPEDASAKLKTAHEAFAVAMLAIEENGAVADPPATDTDAVSYILEYEKAKEKAAADKKAEQQKQRDAKRAESRKKIQAEMTRMVKAAADKTSDTAKLKSLGSLQEGIDNGLYSIKTIDSMIRAIMK